MTTLLRIDASVRADGSASRTLADHFQQLWISAHPGGSVATIDLAKSPPPHLSEETLAAFHGGPPTRGFELSEEWISLLERADDLLISSPLYNLTISSALKAWIDHVVRAGRTFRDAPGGYVGMLKQKRAWLILARGGMPADGVRDDFQAGYLRAILSFLGIDCTEIVSVDGTSAALAQLEPRLQAARERMEMLLLHDRPPQWVGDSTEDDRLEIGRLRSAHAEAILAGDADRYAALCTEDVRLLLPGSEPVVGREQLRHFENSLFQRCRFVEFRKRPDRIEIGAPLAVETGRQLVQQAGGSANPAAAAPKQKYTHVMRKTAQGWRFASLMSNASA